ncbi:polyhydroxyalkanoate synthesis regulator phasin [Saccharopolyspora lacisalsi]|uniref:Polyhydroxyalkanoate synthesis regulator phasin n=1 Tax=Halosaccharopolyspora lacisalsi TaxID=1000566 RepID=A0A839E5B5_9PSEU|nr:DUF6319 family protein [Halosaccharopolyspora lacisalsi]MBA8827045.1 polyhydroxyalkanoate synthesis regulator phasin [Halosaccharopolyspora lacisalsi]
MSDQQDTGTAETVEVTSEQAGDQQQAESTAPKKTKGRKQSTARKTRSVELVLTVTGTAEGEWQAELTHSGKRIVQSLPIPASAVSKAASELHEDISEAIETVISDARQQHENKLAELEAEMERVKKTLADLES